MSSNEDLRFSGRRFCCCDLQLHRLSCDRGRGLCLDLLLQNLLQWTGKEHPDCSLLLGSERALRSTLSRCHVILEEEVRWEEEEEAGQRRGNTETFFPILS